MASKKDMRREDLSISPMIHASYTANADYILSRPLHRAQKRQRQPRRRQHHVLHPSNGSCTSCIPSHHLLPSVPFSIPNSTNNPHQIFTRNKIIGWTSVLFSVQQWLSETPAQKENSGSPAYFSVGMSLLAVGVAYMPLFLPPNMGKAGAGTGTGAPAPAGS